MKNFEAIQRHGNAPKELKETEEYIAKLNTHFQSLYNELEDRIQVLELALKDLKK